MYTPLHTLFLKMLFFPPNTVKVSPFLTVFFTFTPLYCIYVLINHHIFSQSTNNSYFWRQNQKYTLLRAANKRRDLKQLMSPRPISSLETLPCFFSIHLFTSLKYIYFLFRAKKPPNPQGRRIYQNIYPYSCI